jgi:hypothetical protein
MTGRMRTAMLDDFQNVATSFVGDTFPTRT